MRVRWTPVLAPMIVAVAVGVAVGAVVVQNLWFVRVDGQLTNTMALLWLECRTCRALVKLLLSSLVGTALLTVDVFSRYQQDGLFNSLRGLSSVAGGRIVGHVIGSIRSPALLLFLMYAVDHSASLLLAAQPGQELCRIAHTPPWPTAAAAFISS